MATETGILDTSSASTDSFVLYVEDTRYGAPQHAQLPDKLVSVGNLTAKISNSESKVDIEISEQVIGTVTDGELWRLVKGFEKKYRMSSKEFLEAWNEGTAPDTYDTNFWATLLNFLTDDE